MKLKKRLACIHAHYSNIEYIESALSSFDLEITHFVDPALMERISSDANFSQIDAQKKVREQIEWIAESKVDAILITCTNYVINLQEDQLSIEVPIIKIDEPFFEYIINRQEPHTLLFTNPATVEGTLQRLKKHANTHKKTLDIEVLVINNTFDLIMQGLKEEYNQEVYKFIQQIIQDEKRVISVAQLSMVNSAEQVEEMTNKTIMNPLSTLVPTIVSQLKLKKKDF